MKTLVITGGSRGIGAEMVRFFSGKGWRVLFCYRTSKEAAQALSSLTGAVAVCCDVRSEQQVSDLVRTAVRQLGHVDALICNAGAAWTGLTEEMPLSEYERLADTNLKGSFLCIRQFLPLLRSSKGSILLVSSMWGTVGASCETVYSATKAAMQCMARSLAKET
ncbi:MAG: SDR family oxidoreductase, partial [Clostridia bacterium]|nr:SDR family oxidoreductase [Clostridia bacterium]